MAKKLIKYLIHIDLNIMASGEKRNFWIKLILYVGTAIASFFTGGAVGM